MRNSFGSDTIRSVIIASSILGGYDNELTDIVKTIVKKNNTKIRMANLYKGLLRMRVADSKKPAKNKKQEVPSSGNDFPRSFLENIGGFITGILTNMTLSGSNNEKTNVGAGLLVSPFFTGKTNKIYTVNYDGKQVERYMPTGDNGKPGKNTYALVGSAIKNTVLGMLSDLRITSSYKVSIIQDAEDIIEEYIEALLGDEIRRVSESRKSIASANVEAVDKAIRSLFETEKDVFDPETILSMNMDERKTLLTKYVDLSKILLRRSGNTTVTSASTVADMILLKYAFALSGDVDKAKEYAYMISKEVLKIAFNMSVNLLASRKWGVGRQVTDYFRRRLRLYQIPIYEQYQNVLYNIESQRDHIDSLKNKLKSVSGSDAAKKIESNIRSAEVKLEKFNNDRDKLRSRLQKEIIKKVLKENENISKEEAIAMAIDEINKIPPKSRYVGRDISVNKLSEEGSEENPAGWDEVLTKMHSDSTFGGSGNEINDEESDADKLKRIMNGYVDWIIDTKSDGTTIDKDFAEKIKSYVNGGLLDNDKDSKQLASKLLNTVGYSSNPISAIVFNNFGYEVKNGKKKFVKEIAIPLIEKSLANKNVKDLLAHVDYEKEIEALGKKFNVATDGRISSNLKVSTGFSKIADDELSDYESMFEDLGETEEPQDENETISKSSLYIINKIQQELGDATDNQIKQVYDSIRDILAKSTGVSLSSTSNKMRDVDKAVGDIRKFINSDENKKSGNSSKKLNYNWNMLLLEFGDFIGKSRYDMRYEGGSSRGITKDFETYLTNRYNIMKDPVAKYLLETYFVGKEYKETSKIIRELRDGYLDSVSNYLSIKHPATYVELRSNGVGIGPNASIFDQFGDRIISLVKIVNECINAQDNGETSSYSKKECMHYNKELNAKLRDEGMRTEDIEQFMSAIMKMSSSGCVIKNFVDQFVDISINATMITAGVMDEKLANKYRLDLSRFNESLRKCNLTLNIVKNLAVETYKGDDVKEDLLYDISKFVESYYGDHGPEDVEKLLNTINSIGLINVEIDDSGDIDVKVKNDRLYKDIFERGLNVDFDISRKAINYSNMEILNNDMEDKSIHIMDVDYVRDTFENMVTGNEEAEAVNSEIYADAIKDSVDETIVSNMNYDPKVFIPSDKSRKVIDSMIYSLYMKSHMNNILLNGTKVKISGRLLNHLRNTQKYDESKKYEATVSPAELVSWIMYTKNSGYHFYDDDPEVDATKMKADDMYEARYLALSGMRDNALREIDRSTNLNKYRSSMIKYYVKKNMEGVDKLKNGVNMTDSVDVNSIIGSLNYRFNKLVGGEGNITIGSILNIARTEYDKEGKMVHDKNAIRNRLIGVRDLIGSVVSPTIIDLAKKDEKYRHAYMSMIEAQKEYEKNMMKVIGISDDVKRNNLENRVIAQIRRAVSVSINIMFRRIYDEVSKNIYEQIDIDSEEGEKSFIGAYKKYVENKKSRLDSKIKRENVFDVSVINKFVNELNSMFIELNDDRSNRSYVINEINSAINNIVNQNSNAVIGDESRKRKKLTEKEIKERKKNVGKYFDSIKKNFKLSDVKFDNNGMISSVEGVNNTILEIERGIIEHELVNAGKLVTLLRYMHIIDGVLKKKTGKKTSSKMSIIKSIRIAAGQKSIKSVISKISENIRSYITDGVDKHLDEIISGIDNNTGGVSINVVNGINGIVNEMKKDISSIDDIKSALINLGINSKNPDKVIDTMIIGLRFGKLSDIFNIGRQYKMNNVIDMIQSRLGKSRGGHSFDLTGTDSINDEISKKVDEESDKIGNNASTMDEFSKSMEALKYAYELKGNVIDINSGEKIDVTKMICSNKFNGNDVVLSNDSSSLVTAYKKLIEFFKSYGTVNMCNSYSGKEIGDDAYVLLNSVYWSTIIGNMDKINVMKKNEKKDISPDNMKDVYVKYYNRIIQIAAKYGVKFDLESVIDIMTGESMVISGRPISKVDDKSVHDLPGEINMPEEPTKSELSSGGIPNDLNQGISQVESGTEFTNSPELVESTVKDLKKEQLEEGQIPDYMLGMLESNESKPEEPEESEESDDFSDLLDFDMDDDEDDDGFKISFFQPTSRPIIIEEKVSLYNDSDESFGISYNTNSIDEYLKK